MLKNYLKIAGRSLWKEKGFAAINVVGLALSMAVCLLIIQFIREQASYDRFHENADRVIRIVADAVDPDSNIVAVAATPAPLADVIEHEVAGVEEVVRLRPMKAMATVDGLSIGITGYFADESFFDVFSFPLARGSAARALSEPNALVLTPETAEKFFGSRDPMGETLTFEDGSTYTVTGLFEEHLGPSHLRFDAVASMGSVRAWGAERAMLDDWKNYYSYYTYVLLESRRDVGAIEASLPRIIERFYAPEDRHLYAYNVQALTDINLGEVRNNEVGFILPALVAYILSALALAIMLAAAFNYVGLAVARSLTRAREIGIRKVTGACRSQIIAQFLAESVVVALVAVALAFGLLSGLARGFNSLWFVQMSGTSVSIDFAGDGMLYVWAIGFAVMVGLISGAYPAVYLSRFMPIRVLRGLKEGRGMAGMRLRKVLIVSQFALSIVLVVSMAVLYKQLAFMASADYGFDDERIINVALKGSSYEVLRAELAQHPAVENVSATSKLPASGSVSGLWIKTAAMDEAARGYEYAVDEHFIENLGLSLVAGAGFESGMGSGIIINETAVAALGFERPEAALQESIQLDAEELARVVGVVEDYQFDMLDSPIEPMILRYRPEEFRYANVRFRAGEADTAVAHILAAWGKVAGDRPMEYDFFRSQLENSLINILFRDFLRIIGLIALLAVVIALLGTLGTAAYSAEVRLKEVGIRKVVGASAADIALLLSKDYVTLLAVAVLFAAPLAWLLNRTWLSEFANRTEFGPAVLIVSVGALLAAVGLTIASQTVRAALTNPIRVLRGE